MRMHEAEIGLGSIKVLQIINIPGFAMWIFFCNTLHLFFKYILILTHF